MVAGGPLNQYVRFATWLPSVRTAWLNSAEPAGLWHPSARVGAAWGSCSSSDPDLVLDHVRDVDGTTIHLLVVESESGAVLKGAWCRTDGPDSDSEYHWTQDQRLSYDQLRAGEPCPGCGRPFYGGPTWVPERDRTPEQVAAREAEDTGFRAAHPDCRAARWSIQGGQISHCARCCPSPPMSPATEEEVDKLFRRIQAEHDERDQEIARRWKAARSGARRP